MKVQVEGNILKVTTGIKLEALKKGYARPVATDDKGNDVYALEFRSNSPAITDFGMSCNAVINDEVAVVMTLRADVTLDNVKATYGGALVAAAKYLPVIQAKLMNAEGAINEVFAAE